MSVKDKIAELRVSLPPHVTLVAVSKTYPAEAIMEAYEAGQRIFGENRPQEMSAKQAVLPPDIRWHMIGHLQTNKVRMIAPYVDLIHSVDSARLWQVIDREAERAGRTIDILLELHVAQEDQRVAGVDVEDIAGFLGDDELAFFADFDGPGVLAGGRIFH